MAYDRTYRKTTTTTRNSRRPNYIAPPPPAGRRNGNSVLGYWVPLVAIGTLAVGGLAAWVWSERSENDDDDEQFDYDKPPRPSTGTGTGSSGPYPPSYTTEPTGILPHQRPDVAPTDQQYGGTASSYYGESSSQSRNVAPSDQQRNEGTFFTRMSGAIRRSPSPQQFFDSASRQVAAAGAAAGAALSSIMEVDSNGERQERGSGGREERDGFSDHERWSEEAEELSRGKGKGQGRAKRTVAVVLTAESSYSAHEDEDAFHTEHASILSHLPTQHDPTTTSLYILLYSPSLKSLPNPSSYTTSAPSALGSSYSAISTPVQTPGSELQSMSPRVSPSDPHFDALYTQALALVSHPTHILPFTTSDGYVSMLRHLAPQIAYVSEGLGGREGETIAGLNGWVGHTVVVVGDEGHGGLADTETETEDEGRKMKKWWEESDMVGLGKEVSVVDAARVGDDWGRRVRG